MVPHLLLLELLLRATLATIEPSAAAPLAPCPAARAAPSAAPLAVAPLGEPDRDGDGLSDFAELHKHGTDPARADSDGDGRRDGDWDERREFAYTVRSVVRLLPPVTDDALTDDQQDGRVLRRTRDFVEIEVVHYPFHTASSAIVADPDWRKSVAARRDLAPFLRPATCANFDAAMAKALAAELAKAGLDVATADDQTLVARAARWLLDATKYQDGFTTFCFDLGGRTPRVAPGLEARVEQELARCGVALDEQLQRELFAKGMFERRVRGSCTSSAILWCGALRALGVPTRVVLYVPLIDASDPEERGWLATKLAQHRVRRVVTDALAPLQESWSSHTMVEVFVGGRWRLLNYDRLGQPSLDPNYFGLMTHVATLADWSDGDAAKTIGARQCSGVEPRRDDPFGHRNPYSCIELEERFGAHATIDNSADRSGSVPPPEAAPPAAAPLALPIDSLCWSDDPTLPAFVRRIYAERSALPTLLARCIGWSDFAQIHRLTQQGDRRFFLEAEGRPALGLEVEPGGSSEKVDGVDVAWVALPLGPADWRDLATGVAYRLRARNGVAGYEWRIADGATITRAAQ
ncbi:MAG: transglutaminase domain-containing protein [Planctomycetes bacterium]|nr:transglutaminase domain-containing protein [Planctomycetota bacterium]